MKFGIASFVTDEGIRPGPLGAAMEERGFSSLLLTEHSHIPASRETPYGLGGELPRIYYRTLDPFVALTAVAATTRTLRLATGIALVAQRDVIHTAKEVASLDLVSDGRVIFGVGAGWNREEMRNHGTDPATRGEKLDEQLAALKEIWSKELAEFHGKYIDFDPIFAWPKPVQSPNPPIYIGGQSPAALNRLLRFGDGWMPLGNPTLDELTRVRAWLADNGRPDVPVTIFALSRDPATLAGYAEAGVDEVALMLPTQPEAETLTDLDELARLAEIDRLNTPASCRRWISQGEATDRASPRRPLQTATSGEGGDVRTGQGQTVRLPTDAPASSSPSCTFAYAGAAEVLRAPWWPARRRASCGVARRRGRPLLSP